MKVLVELFVFYCEFRCGLYYFFIRVDLSEREFVVVNMGYVDFKVIFGVLGNVLSFLCFGDGLYFEVGDKLWICGVFDLYFVECLGRIIFCM